MITMKSIFTVLFAFIYIGYDIGWSCLFIYITSHPNEKNCEALIQWDKALYIVLLLISFLHLTSCILTWYFYSKQKLLIAISLCKSMCNYIAGIVIMIGIITSFNKGECESLKKYNMIYIITEMSIIGFFCIFICAMSIIKFLVKRKELSNDEISNEEDDI